MGISGQLTQAMLIQRGHLFPWTPVFLAIGIGFYFNLPTEPDLAFYAAAAGLALLGLGIGWRWPGAWSPMAIAIALVAGGTCLAGFRAHRMAAPVLDFRYYGPLEGRVVGLDRSGSDAIRVTLDQVVIARTAPERVPGRVRFSLHGDAAESIVLPGQRIMTTAHLSPPQGPVEPGGFDFRRHAWFLGLGAVGYTRVPVLTAAAPEGGLWIFSVRMALSDKIRTILPGDTGGFAAAVTTGDRSGVSQDTLEALRASNLAHLLAISGLHMGLLVGFVFAILRIGFALVPPLALRAPVRKIAAIGALIVASGYLAMSGGNVATERAFIIVAVALVAVLFDRRALSLRGVAMAAILVLCLRPEALIGPGFQMSFAATTALVAVFGWMRDERISIGPDWLKPALGVLMSSAVAGAATAPVGAVHFNTLSQFGLIANLLSVPLMGALVIPAAVLAACLAPLGLEAVGLWPMGLGLDWILGVAHFVADIEGAQRWVPVAPQAVLPLIALGILWIILWQGRARWGGSVAVFAAFILWIGAERPSVLIADTGALVGVMGQDGRALSKPRGGGFYARAWLENDGDPAVQADAAARWPEDQGAVRYIETGWGPEIVHLHGKRGADAFEGCQEGQIVVTQVRMSLNGDCDLYDPRRLRRTGSIALYPDRVVTAKDLAGARLWTARQ